MIVLGPGDKPPVSIKLLSSVNSSVKIRTSMQKNIILIKQIILYVTKTIQLNIDSIKYAYCNIYMCKNSAMYTAGIWKTLSEWFKAVPCIYMQLSTCLFETINCIKQAVLPDLHHPLPQFQFFLKYVLSVAVFAFRLKRLTNKIEGT